MGSKKGVAAGRPTLTGRDDLLSPDDAGFEGSAPVGVASEGAVDGVLLEVAEDVIGVPEEIAPDPATAVTGAGCSVVAAASPQ